MTTYLRTHTIRRDGVGERLTQLRRKEIHTFPLAAQFVFVGYLSGGHYPPF